MSAPFFTIIIPCRNAARTLMAALNSLKEQTWQDFEIVALSGGSTDGTDDILRDRGNDRLVLVSEPDHGVYHAMNKGARLARGRWLLFLGADDRLADSLVLTQVQAAAVATSATWLCGEATYTDGRIWRSPTQPNIRYRNFLHHQACFYHRSLFAQQAYDESFPIQADYDLNLRLWQTGNRPLPLAVRVAVCGTGGLSDGGSWANYRDEIRVRHQHFPTWRCWPWDFGSIARYLRKKIVRNFANTRPE
jgi:putative colanic acid biosynthesis glycosyltransferase